MVAPRKAIRRVALSAMITAAALAALPSGTATASSYSDRQQQLQQLIQQKEAKLHHLTHRANDLFGLLQETSAQLASTQSRLNSLTLQLIDSRAKLAAIDAQLDVVSAALQQKSAQLVTLLGEIGTTLIYFFYPALGLPSVVKHRRVRPGTRSNPAWRCAGPGCPG